MYRLPNSLGEASRLVYQEGEEEQCDHPSAESKFKYRGKRLTRNDGYDCFFSLTVLRVKLKPSKSEIKLDKLTNTVWIAYYVV